MATILLNGLVKDYDPSGGIDAVTELRFDPTSQNWAAGKTFACPQGFATADTILPADAHAFNMPSDSGIPTNGVDRGTWQSGTVYARYDKVIDPTDLQQYVARIAAPNNALQPHSNLGSWNLATWMGFSPRSLDAGFYGSVRAAGDPTRWFSCEIRAFGVSGAVEPSHVSGLALDGNVIASVVTTYRGAWAPNTVYATNDYVLADGSLWRCSGGGTSNGTAPNWALSAPSYGSTVDEGTPGFVTWQRRYIHKGTWAATTGYSMRVVSGRTPTQGGNDVRGEALIRANGTSFVIASSVKSTDGVTGGVEPAWSAAAAGSFWEDGTIIWRFGTFAINDPTLQSERLILSGLKAPAANGKQITIVNDAGAGTNRDVVLADRLVLDRTGVQNLVGSDKASLAGFDFGGTNLRAAEGQSIIVQYNQAAGVWQLAAGGGGGGGSLVDVLKGGTVPGVYARTIAPAGTTGNNTHNVGGANLEALDADGLVAQLNVEAIGATPTLTWVLEGSVDGQNWFTVPYVDNTADTPVFAASTVTAVGQYLKFFWRATGAARFFRFFRVRTTANTNVTYSCVVAWQERPDA